MSVFIFFNPKIHGERLGWKSRSQDPIGKVLDYPKEVMIPKRLSQTHKEMGIDEIFVYSLPGESNRINKDNPDQNYLPKDYVEIVCSNENKAEEINKKIKDSGNKFLDELFAFYINQE